MRILFRVTLLWYALLLTPIFCLAQYEKFILQERSFEKSDQIDSLNSTLQLHYKEALLQRDTLEQIKVLKWIYWYNDNSSEAELIKASLMALAKDYSNEILMSEVYYAFASKEIESGNVESGLANLRSSYKAAIKLDQYNQALDAIKAYNSLVTSSPEYAQALNELNFFKNILASNEALSDTDKSKLILNVELEKAIVFLNSNQIDSSLNSYNYLLSNESLLENKNFGAYKLYEATLNYRLDYFLKSRDTLQKYLNLFNQTQKKEGWYILSLVEDKLGNSEKSISFLKRIDSVLENDGYPYYGNAISTYRKLVGVSKDSLKDKYLGLLYYYENSERFINGDLGYDVSNRNEHIIWLGGLAILLLVGFILLYHRKKSEKSNSTKLTQPRLTEFSFIEDLRKWEEEKKYLNSGVTLSSLSSDVGSNTSYLSKYFNQELGVSFSTYLGKIRINYLLKQIKSNPEIFSKKSSIQIAECLGFKSIDAYTRAFKLTTGNTPSQYIKSLLNSDLN